MFVRNQPVGARTSATHGRSYPYIALGHASLARSLVYVKHVCERDSATARNVELVGVQADEALVFVEPSQEVAADFVRSPEPGRRDDVEIHDVCGIQSHQTIDVLCLAGIDAPVQ